LKLFPSKDKTISSFYSKTFFGYWLIDKKPLVPKSFGILIGENDRFASNNYNRTIVWTRRHL
jgi:hypothetical protein